MSQPSPLEGLKGDPLALAQSLLPQKAGDEPLFHAPWEARIFALVVAMVERTHLDWAVFQQRLAARITEREAAEGLAPQSCQATEVSRFYYESWLQAAEDTLAAEQLLSEGEVEEKILLLREAVEALREKQRGG
ncbi:MAG: nitrile hydratase accessory protein [Pseudomonadota bacterium]